MARSAVIVLAVVMACSAFHAVDAKFFMPVIKFAPTPETKPAKAPAPAPEPAGGAAAAAVAKPADQPVYLDRPKVQAVVAKYTTILAAAEGNKLTVLVAAIKAANMTAPVTDKETTFTVFAPTDAAFAALAKKMGTTPDKLLADKATLTKILQFHILPGSVIPSKDFVSDLQLSSALKGKDLIIKAEGGKVQVMGDSTTATVVVPDQTAGKAVVHVVDTVLVPM